MSSNIRIGWKLPKAANTLAYYIGESVAGQAQGWYSQQFIFCVTYEWAQYAWVFVPGRLFQPSLIFARKASQNIRLSQKSLPGTNTQAYWAHLLVAMKIKSCEYRPRLGHWPA
jgi:hypothetical protein